MKEQFNKGLLLTSLGSFWWGFIGVLYFQYVSFIGHIELVVHRCLWTAIILILSTTFLSKWKIFLMVWKQILNLLEIKLTLCLKIISIMDRNNGGETEIRTQERVAPLPVFKTGAFNRSAISPCRSFYN